LIKAALRLDFQGSRTHPHRYVLEENLRPRESRDLRRIRQGNAPASPRAPTMRSLVKLALRCENAEQMGKALRRRWDRQHPEQRAREDREVDRELERLFAGPADGSARIEKREQQNDGQKPEADDGKSEARFTVPKGREVIGGSPILHADAHQGRSRKSCGSRNQRAEQWDAVRHGTYVIVGFRRFHSFRLSLFCMIGIM
jgi:hypothetical protein